MENLELRPAFENTDLSFVFGGRGKKKCIMETCLKTGTYSKRVEEV